MTCTGDHWCHLPHPYPALLDGGSPKIHLGPGGRGFCSVQPTPPCLKSHAAWRAMLPDHLYVEREKERKETSLSGGDGCGIRAPQELVRHRAGEHHIGPIFWGNPALS